MKTELKGVAPYDNGLGDRILKAYEYVANKPELRVFQDVESGEPSIITKKEHDKHLEMWEACKPIYIPELNVDRFFVFGTGGNMDSDDLNNFEKLWMK